MRRSSRVLGILLLTCGLLFVGVGIAADGVGAQESGEEDTAPVIGDDSGEDVADDDSGDVEGELAATGSSDRILTPMGLLLILAGTLLTMVGQPAEPRGLHSAPTSKLRGSFFGLATSSISESVRSGRRRR